MRIKCTFKAFLAGFVCLLFLSGCSASFAGFSLGGREELVFACDGEETQTASAEIKEASAETETGSGDAKSAATAESEGAQEEASAEAETDETGVETADAQAVSSDGLVNINTAGLEELMTLNGIGETRAKAIIAYRETNGPFQKTEDLMQISGIKEGIFSKLEAQITVQ